MKIQLANQITEIVESNRRYGSTTWILKSALQNPNCLIISRDMNISDRIKQTYNKMYFEVFFLKRLFWKLMKRKTPVFTSLSNHIHGYARPIVFDNRCF